MIEKIKEKEKAIRLRKRGFSYKNISEEINVAKSTLSLWLKKIELNKKQKEDLINKRIKGALMGAKSRKEQKIYIRNKIKKDAIKDIKNLSEREIWLIGVALYWAEGKKERDKCSLVSFSNSDSKMISFFIKWIYQVFKVKKEDLVFRIYLHESSKKRLEEVRSYWANAVGLKKEYFDKVSWKKNKIKTKRKNTEKNYYGLLSVNIKKSVNLNRKIQGWIDGICS